MRLAVQVLGMAATLLSGCAATPEANVGLGTSPTDPLDNLPVVVSTTSAGRQGVIEGLVAIMADQADAPLESVFNALEAAREPSGATGGGQARLGVYVQSCRSDRGPVMERVQARVCPAGGGSFRAVFHLDLRAAPDAGQARLETIRALLLQVGHSTSEAIRWPAHQHLPAPDVKTVFLPRGGGPVIVIEHDGAMGSIRDVAMFWPRAD